MYTLLLYFVVRVYIIYYIKICNMCGVWSVRRAGWISCAAWTVFVTPQPTLFFFTLLYTRYTHKTRCALCACVRNTAQFYVIKIIGWAARGRRRRGSNGVCSGGGVVFRCGWRRGRCNGGDRRRVDRSRRRPRQRTDEGGDGERTAVPAVAFLRSLVFSDRGKRKYESPPLAHDGFADVSCIVYYIHSHAVFQNISVFIDFFSPLFLYIFLFFFLCPRLSPLFWSISPSHRWLRFISFYLIMIRTVIILLIITINNNVVLPIL